MVFQLMCTHTHIHTHMHTQQTHTHTHTHTLHNLDHQFIVTQCDKAQSRIVYAVGLQSTYTNKSLLWCTLQHSFIMLSSCFSTLRAFMKQSSDTCNCIIIFSSWCMLDASKPQFNQNTCVNVLCKVCFQNPLQPLCKCVKNNLLLLQGL